MDKLPYSVYFINFTGAENLFNVFYALYPPLGMAYIAAVIKNKVRETAIIDAPAMNYQISNILKIIAEKKPDFIGMTVFTAQVNSAIRLCGYIKAVSPETKTVLGGPHAFFMHEQIMTNSHSIDYCLRGEGEYAFRELLETLNSRQNLENVKGLTFRRGKDIVANPERPLIKNLDDIPFPARELLPNEKYRAVMALGGRKKFTSMVVSRGCPFACTFCDSAARWKQTIRFRSVDNVIGEMVEVKNKYGVKYIRFGDDLFTYNKNWVKEFHDKYHKNKLKIQWACDARVEMVNPEMLRMMKASGCNALFYGIEFGNEKIRLLTGKKFSNDRIRYAIDIAKKARIPVYGLFMMGYPGEDKNTIRETINMSFNLGLDWAGFSIVAPLPGTALYKYCEDNNLLKSHNWSDFSTKATPVLKHDKLTDKEILNLWVSWQRKFYLRPKYILKRLFKLRSIKDFYFAFRFVIESIKNKIKANA